MGKIIKVHFGSNYLFKNNICIFLVIKLHILTVKKKKERKYKNVKLLIILLPIGNLSQ